VWGEEQGLPLLPDWTRAVREWIQHGGNGYLIEQFLNPLVNLRTDDYGGSNDGRNRLALEIAGATVAAIGPVAVCAGPAVPAPRRPFVNRRAARTVTARVGLLIGFRSLKR
jgi:hypothetical protein